MLLWFRRLFKLLYTRLQMLHTGSLDGLMCTFWIWRFSLVNDDRLLLHGWHLNSSIPNKKGRPVIKPVLFFFNMFIFFIFPFSRFIFPRIFLILRSIFTQLFWLLFFPYPNKNQTYYITYIFLKNIQINLQLKLYFLFYYTVFTNTLDPLSFLRFLHKNHIHIFLLRCE